MKFIRFEDFDLTKSWLWEHGGSISFYVDGLGPCFNDMDKGCEVTEGDYIVKTNDGVFIRLDGITVDFVASLNTSDLSDLIRLAVGSGE